MSRTSAALLLAAALCVFAASPAVAESCSITTAELTEALDAVHASRGKTPAESAPVVDQWLPKATMQLATTEPLLDEWLHLSVDLGRELTRLDRRDEARQLYARVAELDPNGQWGRNAKKHLAEFDAK
ncbi:MAG TPA: hypothetical protein VHL59_03970 [Thermoanaerobaculia bacterium]|nr:hypothetical protein [Thermoanaerobaculia bacterium]